MMHNKLHKLTAILLFAFLVFLLVTSRHDGCTYTPKFTCKVDNSESLTKEQIGEILWSKYLDSYLFPSRYTALTWIRSHKIIEIHEAQIGSGPSNIFGIAVSYRVLPLDPTDWITGNGYEEEIGNETWVHGYRIIEITQNQDNSFTITRTMTGG